jgi:hypothetical protein
MPIVSGSFDVKLAPAEVDARPEAAFLGRLTIAKTFSGPLTGTSVGQMLAASTAVAGSAGYVALEQVTGTLEGKAGSFMLQHSGHANRGANTLRVNVVADSGTGQLSGLTGEVQIIRTDTGTHQYVFDYELRN